MRIPYKRQEFLHPVQIEGGHIITQVFLLLVVGPGKQVINWLKGLFGFTLETLVEARFCVRVVVVFFLVFAIRRFILAKS